MNQDDLKAITTVVASAAFTADRLWLNGVCVTRSSDCAALLDAAPEQHAYPIRATGCHRYCVLIASTQ